MSARKTKQPTVRSGRIFTVDDYAYIGRMMSDAYEHRLKQRGATYLENATHERGNAFAAAPGSETERQTALLSAAEAVVRSVPENQQLRAVIWIEMKHFQRLAEAVAALSPNAKLSDAGGNP